MGLTAKWQVLIESLHKVDRELLLKMISETRNHDESSFDLMANSKESEYNIMYFFFLWIMMQKQGLLNKIIKTQI